MWHGGSHTSLGYPHNPSSGPHLKVHALGALGGGGDERQPVRHGVVALQSASEGQMKQHWKHAFGSHAFGGQAGEQAVELGAASWSAMG